MKYIFGGKPPKNRDFCIEKHNFQDRAHRAWREVRIFDVACNISMRNTKRSWRGYKPKLKP